jgi:hypothetical protein
LSSADAAAPFGLDDIFAMVIRPNRSLDNALSHQAEARRAQAIWPEVTVIPWESEAAGFSIHPRRNPSRTRARKKDRYSVFSPREQRLALQRLHPLAAASLVLDSGSV